jgi:biopolymer transport protein ExbB
MIGAFRSIAEADDVNAQIVASGIYEALITTVFGLCIAIVAMSAHSLFSHIVDNFASRVEIACSDLIVKLSEYKRLNESIEIDKFRSAKEEDH